MSIIDDKWNQIFEKYNIEQEIATHGCFYITADQIREFKEPRLMTKFDTKESLPDVFREHIAILPVTRGKYVLGKFDLYQQFPEFKQEIRQMKAIKIPDYLETININEINSEANAINIMGITSILDDFLGEENMIQTVSGRMGSGSFSFLVHGEQGKSSHRLQVNNSQVEIDGGFENANIFTLIEGKNVVHNNFLVRQLYYPYRLWEGKIKKPIRPVFMVYSNNIFRLLEYRFADKANYNSIQLVQERNYSLEDITITGKDLAEVLREAQLNVHYETLKKQHGTAEFQEKTAGDRVPFIQADSFQKVISLVENLKNSALTPSEIAELFGFRDRQSDYYFNACRYLGLAQKRKDEEGQIKVCLNNTGKKLLKMNYKNRQLEYVRLILKHGIFRDLFEIILRTGEIPDRREITRRIIERKLCKEASAARRASTVSGWLRWMKELESV